jgi:hypothetical protein
MRVVYQPVSTSRCKKGSGNLLTCHTHTHTIMAKYVPVVYKNRPVTHTNRIEHWYQGRILYRVTDPPIEKKYTETDDLVWDDALDPYIRTWKLDRRLHLKLMHRCCRKLAMKRPPTPWAPPQPDDTELLFIELYQKNPSTASEWIRELRETWGRFPVCIELFDKVHVDWVTR